MFGDVCAGYGARRALAVVAVALSAATLAGCGHISHEVVAESHYRQRAPAPPRPARIESLLLEQYDQWKGTRYRDGGLSLNGVDCSGFVYLTFKTRLGLLLPRSADSQLGVGTDIPRAQLKAGDLVFFRIGSYGLHVGIYLDHGRFMHASKSHGVIISTLHNVYWNKVYWKARRAS